MYCTSMAGMVDGPSAMDEREAIRGGVRWEVVVDEGVAKVMVLVEPSTPGEMRLLTGKEGTYSDSTPLHRWS